MADKNKPLETRYKMILKEIEKAGMRTIGKTTYKVGKVKKTSQELKELQKKKRETKKQIQKEKEKPKKDLLITKFKILQEKIQRQII